MMIYIYGLIALIFLHTGVTMHNDEGKPWTAKDIAFYVTFSALWLPVLVFFFLMALRATIWAYVRR